MPDRGSVLKFKNHSRSMRVPFVVGADFETCTKPISDCEPDNDKSFTRINHVGLSHRLLR